MSLFKVLQSKLPEYATELIIDFIYGDNEFCEKKSKEVMNISSLYLTSLITMQKLKKTKNIVSIKISRKDDSKNMKKYMQNILLQIDWGRKFIGPRTILLMYDRAYESIITYETYGFFWNYKPDFISLESWKYVKTDVVIHNNLEKLIVDIYREDTYKHFNIRNY